MKSSCEYASRWAAPWRLACIPALVLLVGCAGLEPDPIPETILNPPAGDLQLVEADQAPERHLGARVRWGGTIIAVARDASGATRVEVLERRLDESGRPRPGSPSDGRFIILAAPTVDPDLYARGGDITVAGVLDAPVAGMVGDEPALFPVVQVEAFVRWEPPWREYPYPYGPYYPYDPFYPGPWYGPGIRFGAGVGYGAYRPFYPGYWHRYYGW